MQHTIRILRRQFGTAKQKLHDPKIDMLDKTYYSRATRCPFRKFSASLAPCFLAWFQVIYAAKLAAAVRSTKMMAMALERKSRH
jgi:hypothetical protein